jgi:nucleoside-triphosphatase
MSAIPPRVLITGAPGVGKTTVVQKVLKELSVLVGGFTTEEIREGGKRLGFRLRTLDGQEGILAHVGSRSKYRVGKYGVEVETFERIAVPALDRALRRNQLVVLDELGRMELYSRKFQDKVMEVFGSTMPIMAVIQDRRNPFLDGIRGRGDVTMYRVTVENRDDLVGGIVKKFKSVKVEKC